MTRVHRPETDGAGPQGTHGEPLLGAAESVSNGNRLAGCFAPRLCEFPLRRHEDAAPGAKKADYPTAQTIETKWLIRTHPQPPSANNAKVEPKALQAA